MLANPTSDRRPLLIFHEGNEAMIAVMEKGSNPTMRHIGRVHGISIKGMHEQFMRTDVPLGHIHTELMAADVHTKAYSDLKAAEWMNVRQHINVLSAKERTTLTGQPGHGYINRKVHPEKYMKPDVTSGPWEELDAGAVADEEHGLFEGEGGKSLTMAADCAGLGSAIEAVLSLAPNSTVEYISELDDETRDYLTRNLSNKVRGGDR